MRVQEGEDGVHEDVRVKYKSKIQLHTETHQYRSQISGVSTINTVSLKTVLYGKIEESETQ